MPSTTNFGWTTPADTDLVKDGASAIRTLGNGIDTSFVDLKGGTTGQVLAKATNADLDFTWVTSAGDIEGVTAGVGISGGGTSGTVTITNSMATAIDAKGDLVVGTGADTFSRLGVGTDNQVLMADSSTATGVKWGTASGGQLQEQVFTSSTSWTVPTGVTRVWAMVVAGGGAGGYVPGSLGSFSGAGGGGGGGGCVITTLATTPGASLTVTIGAGGSNTPYPTATNGSNSVFGTITATGGRSGGLVGGAPAGSSSGAGGAGAGSSSNGNPQYASAGGGGSTYNNGMNGFVGGGTSGTYRAAGYSAGDRTAGYGGGGECASTVSGSVQDTFGGCGAGGAQIFANGRYGFGGGGGGGIGVRGGSSTVIPGRGVSGGGDGGAAGTASTSTANGSDGIANTGGGGGGGATGGGGGANANGGAGGSGIVVIRWVG